MMGGGQKMIIIGELINASRKAMAQAIETQDVEAIRDIAVKQAEAGAHYIDVNAGVFVDKEADYLRWLVKIVQDSTDLPCAVDSPNPKALAAALEAHEGTAMVNSISLEKERYETLLPIVAGTDLKIIALCMSDEGMPRTVDERMRIADTLIDGLVQKNIPLDNIYVDPLVQPMSVNTDFGMDFINTIEKIHAWYPGIHTACGLSNISYGMPARQFMNQIFMVMAITKGLDGAICNPLDRRMMAHITAAQTLAGNDPYGLEYLKAFRNKEFELT